MAIGKKTGGRQAGTPNKLTTAARDAIAQVFEGLGGVDAMLRWAGTPEGEKVFYGTVYPKLLPLQLTGEGGGPVAIQEVRRLVIDPNA